MGYVHFVNMTRGVISTYTKSIREWFCPSLFLSYTRKYIVQFILTINKTHTYVEACIFFGPFVVLSIVKLVLLLSIVQL